MGPPKVDKATHIHAQIQSTGTLVDLAVTSYLGHFENS